MARLITKFKYMKPGENQSKKGKKPGGYAKYIGTREGVDKIDDSKKNTPSTTNQQKIIQKILKDFPDSKDMHEYSDYIKSPTVTNASEFISRALEDNSYEAAGRDGYAKYIALRPRAERTGTHGLFTDDGVEVNLSKVAEEMNNHEGNIWTVIISLRREDAERLGFNTGERWRSMLRSQTAELSKNFKIPMTHLKWYAAFHNESHHPHVHMIVYSSDSREGYLSPMGINNLRSSLANDIFKQDQYCTYEKQTEYRDRLRIDGKKYIADIVEKINTEQAVDPQIQAMLLQLADKLSRTKGKKVYGYLKPEVKAIVDAITIRLSENEQITKLYDLWYQQKENAIKVYSDELPPRIPLVNNKEFKPLKNAIIQEALKISQHKYGGETADSDDEGQEVHRKSDEEIPLPIPPDDEYILFPEDDEVPTEENEQDEDEEQPQENTPAPMSEKNPNKTWWTERYKLARFYLYGDKEHDSDFEKAIELLKTESAKGNGFAIYDLGKMYLSGLGCNKDEISAQEYFGMAYFAFINQLAKTKNPAYLQYRIGKLYALGYGVEQDNTQAASWYQKSVDAQNPFAAYALARLYFRGQGVAQDDSRAFELYQMADTNRNKPNAYAQYELGRMCRDGIGTSVDTGASDYWFRKAYQGFLKVEKDLADDKLYYRLGQMNLKGVGTEIDLQKAREYFEKAIKLGNDNAMLALGKMYIYGNGVPEDFNIGVNYLKMSAAQGNTYSAELLEKLENDRNYFSAIGSLRLLQYLGRMLQNRIDDRKIEAEGKTDRKLYRKIQEKKQAQGLK